MAAALPNEEVPIGFLPLDAVKNTIEKTKSPGGRYVILPANGTVRIYDSPGKIQETKQAIEALQSVPAMVSIALTVRTGARRVTRQQYPAQEPVHSYEVPIPRIYDPTRIVEPAGGGLIIVPGQPRNFTTRRVEPGTFVNISPSGYTTLSPEVRLGETSLEGGVARKYVGSTAIGKSVAFPVLRKVEDPRALHDLARQQGAIAGNEPEWAAAGTELSVTPALSNGYLSVQVTPQIIVSTADGRAIRRIPVSNSGTSFLAQRSTKMPMETAPAGDAEFYRLFFGAKENGAEAVTLFSLTAGVQHIGSR